MCLGMNPDQLAPGERSASTSNRNFEGRQGKGGRTHLVSPLVAAATAVVGRLAAPADLAADADADRGGADRWSRSPRTPAAPSPLRRVQRRHRPDHPGRLPQAGHPHRLRGRPVRRLAQRPRLRAQPARARAGATILVAGPDFGTGSSREHAVWALAGLRLPGRHLLAVRRHLPGQRRQGRPAHGRGRAGGRRAAVGGRRGRPGHRGDRRPRAADRVVAPDAIERRSRSTTTPAGGCSRASTTSA